MIDDVRALMDQYAAWLRNKTTLREVRGVVEVTTPYLDRHNDYLQFYVRPNNGGYQLTDDGFVIQDLRSSGCSLDSQKRQDLLRMTLNGFGVKLEGDTLTVNATNENFNYRKHNFLQAMLAVNDLFYLAVPMVASLFLEDVISWLDVHEIRYTQNVKFTGKSGYDHHFNFVIPKSPKAPERIIQAITRPSRDTAEALAFSWIDTREVRPPNSKAIALLNDSDLPASSAVVDALKNYDVTPVAWSRREDIREALAA